MAPIRVVQIHFPLLGFLHQDKTQGKCRRSVNGSVNNIGLISVVTH